MEEPLRGYLTRSKIEKIAAVLRDGGVAVLPTDTIYGLHCAASDMQAVRRIRRIKERGGVTGLILLASDIEMVDHLVSRWPSGTREILSGIWPAPLTAILPASESIAPSLAPKGRAAVRIPALPELRRCIELTGHPLVSTSVNVSGRRPMTRISEIMKKIPGLAAYISQRGRPSSKPSTIVDMTASPPSIIRIGRYHWPPRREETWKERRSSS